MSHDSSLQTSGNDQVHIVIAAVAQIEQASNTSLVWYLGNMLLAAHLLYPAS